MAIRNWLKRMFEQDRPDRYPVSGLLAFFWDGGPPVPHSIKDISSGGAYIFATERWYTGTILDISFREKRQPAEATQKASTFTIQCRVARHGPDGMGVAFLPRNSEQQEAIETIVGRLKLQRELWELGKVVYSAS